jgi:stage V sporulation protein AD
MIRLGKNSYEFENVFVTSSGTCCGPKEAQGPFGNYFDLKYQKEDCGKNSWEEAEEALLKGAIDSCLFKAGRSIHDMDLLLGGDLSNQLAIHHDLYKNIGVPFLGMYAACSSLTETIGVASLIMDNHNIHHVLCSVSSHNSTSERQFRYPTEYGGQKPVSLTSTATGAGAVLLSNTPSRIKVKQFTVGEIADVGLKDPADMGRTMAPAAFLTLKQHLQDTNASLSDYDLILTGDLSTFGAKVFQDLMRENQMDTSHYEDAGILLYDRARQNVLAGGSGCGCIALMGLGYVVKSMLEKKYHRVLLLATGALHNPIMIAQGKNIPTISHAIVLEANF